MFFNHLQRDLTLNILLVNISLLVGVMKCMKMSHLLL